MPDDIRADIARVVRLDQVHWLNRRRLPYCEGGSYLALRLLGWKPQFCVGGMLYCAGLSAIGDTMAFRGQDKAG